MNNTGSQYLDKHFNYGNHVTCFYGKPSTGKTNFCLISTIALAKNKKVFFIDSENSFSIQRICQLTDKIIFPNIIQFKVRSIFEQSRLINQLHKMIKNCSLIVVDSFTHYYRSQVKRDPKFANLMLNKQLKTLNSLAKENNIPVLITSQVYDDFNNNIHPVAKNILNKHCKCMIKLENEQKRKLIIEKHPKNFLKTLNFTINEQGITEE